MFALLRRLPVCLLALLPVVWGNCPYWFVGSPGASGLKGSQGANAPRDAEPRCPCCRRKADSGPARGSTNPYDCGDCPMIVARHGSAPAPAPVVLPDAHDAGTFAAVVVLPLAGIDPALAVSSARGAAGPPNGPPGGVVSTLLDEVSLRI